MINEPRLGGKSARRLTTIRSLRSYVRALREALYQMGEDPVFSPNGTSRPTWDKVRELLAPIPAEEDA